MPSRKDHSRGGAGAPALSRPSPNPGNFSVEALEGRRLLSAVVVARQVFYDNSVFDGNVPALGASDDQAIAVDKQALLPGGTAGFSNYTSYSRGLNGLSVDIQAMPGTPNVSDFVFNVGNNGNPAGWANAPAPTAMLVRPFSGLDNSSRIEFSWADGAILNQWLQVTVKADANTGLATPDVFYFGNETGESGMAPSLGAFPVTAVDVSAVASDPHSLFNPAQVLNTHDYNRDGLVDAVDQQIASANLTVQPSLALQVITVPGSVPVVSHPSPTLTGGWQFTALPGAVTLDSGHVSNVFYQGQAVGFALSAAASIYEVRDYWGDLVDSGAATGTSITVNVNAPGWYKLYLYGATSNATFGDVVGGTTFSIITPNSNFPVLPDFIAHGKYFTPTLTRIDSQVNFNSTVWGFNAPDPSLPGSFGVRWTGQIVAPATGTYTFSVEDQDGARLWVNGIQLINDWKVPQSGIVDKGTIALQGGTRYNIELDYYHDVYTRDCVMSWSSGGSANTIVPTSALFPTSQSQIPIGLTGVYYAPLPQDPTGANDQIVRDATGMGPIRYSADASNPSASIASLAPMITYDAQNYTPLDPQRGRSLLIAFPNGTDPYLSGVTQIVSQFQNQVKYWEPQNEPNFAYANGASFVPVMRNFYNTVKAVNPNLQVIGPGTVTINPLQGGLQWIQQFLAAGGGQYLNGFSFHFYNGMNGDLALGRRTLQDLQNLLNQYGLGSIPKWQTEQGYFAAEYGVYDPEHEARWTMLEQMLFEQNGIPKERNVLWYDKSHGFWDVPAFWENDDGSLNPAAVLMRTWSAELFGTNYSSAFNFGADNNLYIGSLFTGSGKSIAAFMSAGGGDLNQPVQLSISSGSTLHVVSAFGVAADLPVVNGQVTLPVPNLPIYVELAAGQSVSVVNPNYGPDVALAAGTNVTSSASAAANATISTVVNGQYEDWYYQQNSPFTPFVDDTPSGQSDWVMIDLLTAQWVDRVVIYASPPWQIFGTLLNYSVQYNDNGTWVDLNRAAVAPKTLAAFTPTTRTTVDTYWNEQSQFISTFLPVLTKQIRVLVTQKSYGGGATLSVSQAGGQTNGAPFLDLQEIEVDGKLPTTLALQSRVINGTSGNDSIYLARDPDNVHIDWAMANAGGQMAINDAQGLTINGGGGTDSITLNYAGGSPLPFVFHLNGTFSISGLSGSNPFGGTTMEIGQSTVYFNYAGGASPVASVRAALLAGFNGGGWNGIGTSAGAITSATAAAAGGVQYAVGYADSVDGVVVGQPNSTVEVRYTVVADANLDRVVNSTDAILMSRNWLKIGAPWDQGDFNYDGTVDFADAHLLQSRFNVSVIVSLAEPADSGASTSGGAGADAGSAPVANEPTTPIDPTPISSADQGTLDQGGTGESTKLRRGRHGLKGPRHSLPV